VRSGGDAGTGFLSGRHASPNQGHSTDAIPNRGHGGNAFDVLSRLGPAVTMASFPLHPQVSDFDGRTNCDGHPDCRPLIPGLIWVPG
jgi:hypothetical protein